VCNYNTTPSYVFMTWCTGTTSILLFFDFLTFTNVYQQSCLVLSRVLIKPITIDSNGTNQFLPMLKVINI
jgi:hypothetical protein